jgi:hypothetical protein
LARRRIVPEDKRYAQHQAVLIKAEAQIQTQDDEAGDHPDLYVVLLDRRRHSASAPEPIRSRSTVHE